MSMLLQSTWQRCFGKTEKRILIHGLDAAGKTTTLYQLKLGKVVTTIPTIGFNVETMDHQNISFTMWDLGGRDKIRPLWRFYYPGTQAIIFVVDSNGRDRLEDAREELCKFLNEEMLQSVPLLVFANKQDLPGVMSADEIANRLGLCNLVEREWFVQASSAVTADGLSEGLDWLCQNLNDSNHREMRCQLASIMKPKTWLALL
eukprot:gnl/MRDRNA2_/MRDRNA2_99533_c0_seq1.p1 gnl/MRDRNA2_/MRDRNA2_99533_c0~~gnl/MRDRNA2_/MRDRNA2_99533_c0_seq1.p1  ORF type:complete len:203 (+),score=42.15 gnl/MRDRNA2_/MRDRNA2_99533_c0_seq1:85-693(+)